MKATISLCVILVAAVLTLGDGASLPTDNREEAQKSGYYHYYSHYRPHHYQEEAQKDENNDVLSEMDNIQRALNQAAAPSNDYLKELKDQPTQSDENVLADRLNVLSQAATEDKQFLEELKDQPTPTPSDEKELADRLDVLSQATSSSGDNISQGDAVAFQTYLRIKYIGCASTYCTPTSGPGLYMNTYDWYTNPVTGFQIYRMNGKGNVKVGEVIAIYYPKEKKWMKCSGSYCTKDTCPGRPSQGNGMEDYEKWIGCSESVFKIYANGRNEGDNIRQGDDISLYHVKDRKWVTAQTSYIQKNTCFGTTRPPSSHSYDTCYKEVFELFKC